MPYRYAGLEPVPDGKGGIVRPGDIRDKAPQEFGPWDEIPGGPEEPQDAPPAPSPPAPSPAPAGPSQPATPPAAGNGGN